MTNKDKHKVLSSVIFDMIKLIDQHAQSLIKDIFKLKFDAENYYFKSSEEAKCPHIMSYDFKRKCDHISNLLSFIENYLRTLKESIEVTVQILDKNTEDKDDNNYNLVPSYTLRLKHYNDVHETTKKMIDKKYVKLIDSHMNW